jgi:hypothetical protein
MLHYMTDILMVCMLGFLPLSLLLFIAALSIYRIRNILMENKNLFKSSEELRLNGEVIRWRGAWNQLKTLFYELEKANLDTNSVLAKMAEIAKEWGVE